MAKTEELSKLLEKGKKVQFLKRENGTDRQVNSLDLDWIDINGWCIQTPHIDYTVQQPEKSQIRDRQTPTEQIEMNHHHTIFLVLLLVSVLLFASGLMLLA